MRLKIKAYFKKSTDINNIFSEFFSFCASVRHVFGEINEKKRRLNAFGILNKRIEPQIMSFYFKNFLIFLIGIIIF